MSNIKLIFFSCLIVTIAILYSCDKDDNTNNPTPDPNDSIPNDSIPNDSIPNDSIDTLAFDTAVVNKWIYDVMKDVYLWTDNLPAYKESLSEPREYYSSLLYTPTDRWSYMTDDYTALINSLNGVELSTGYSLALYRRYSTGDDVIGIVNYVYNNSPADIAGLKRGDILIKVNGETITISNYIDLLYETNNQKLTLGAVFESTQGNTIEETGVVLDVVAEEIETNPIVHYEVIEEGGLKIGYLVYTDYITSYCAPSYDKEGTSDMYLNSVFKEFKTVDVDEVILDLRYNRGGANTAAKYLATTLAPSDITDNSIFIKYVWNTGFTNYWKENGKTDQLEEKFLAKNNVEDMNLSRLVVLTTGNTASASELTIVALEPYMEVITVGEQTHGKYVGSSVFPDDDEKWALMPIIVKYSNVDGYTDFKNGLEPDIKVNEGGVLYPFGDLRDPILAAGVEALTGENLSAQRSATLKGKLELKKVGDLPASPFKKDGLLHIDINDLNIQN